MPDKKRRGVFKWIIMPLLVVFLVSFRLVEEIGFDRHPADRFKVAAINDGDSMELLGGDRLRLLSVDTPEKGDLLYDRACRFLSELSLGKQGRIEFAGRRRDKYGRLLGYLYIDSIFVNQAIIEEGLGYLYLFSDTEPDRPETARLLAAQRRAMKNKVGLWAIERTPEDYYLAGQNSFRFHRPGCPLVGDYRPDRHRMFKTREEALYEGLSPCRKCQP